MTRPSRNHAQDETPQDHRVSAIFEMVRKMGLHGSKTERVSMRLNPDLLRLAKEKTGIESSSSLFELAIASLVIDDGFPEAFRRARGRVPEDIDLEI